VSRGARTTSQRVFPSTGRTAASFSNHDLPVPVEHEHSLLHGGENAVQLLHPLRPLLEQRLHAFAHGVEAVCKRLHLIAPTQMKPGSEIAGREPADHLGQISERGGDGP
jgi:hypothetical protein